MRAQIVYTVDISEIPSEVDRLKEKVTTLLSTTLSHIKSLDIEESPLKSIDSFERASEELITIDLLLRDSAAILQGYLAAKTGPASPIRATDHEASE